MQNKIEQAVILGAGLGTRLRPLTSKVPKVMVPIAENKPLLAHTVELLKKQGIKKFIINLHYLPEQIVNYFGDGKKFGVEIVYSDEAAKLMDTAGAIKKAENLLNENFLFLYGDEVHFFDFTQAVSLHQRNGALATVVLKRSGHPQNGELAEVDNNNQVINWVSRPHSIQNYENNYYLNGGLYVISKKILNHIPAGRPVSLDREVLPKLIENRSGIFGFPANEEILDIGTPEKYQFAKNWYRQKAN